MSDPLGDATRPLTPDEVAERWDCSKGLVVQLCKEGKLRHFRVGKLYRITPAAIAEYEAQPATPKDAAAPISSHRGSEAADAASVRRAIRFARQSK